MVDTKFHLDSFKCWYINNCLMDSFSGIMKWFTQKYFLDFKTTVIGGYDRAIREIQNNLNDGTDGVKAALPAISLNPFGDISTDPKFAQLWRLHEIGVNLQDLYMEPEYQDEYFGFTVMFNRFIGNFEVVIYVQSPYEYLDHYMQTLMFFHGGFNRRVRPGLIQTHALIPEEVVTTSYRDAPYDWSQTNITNEFDKVINRDYFVYPIEIGPQIWLTGVTNASTIYGEDALSSYKIQITCEYDIDLPTHIIVRNNDLIEKMNIKIATTDPIFIPGKLPTYESNDSQVVIDDPNLSYSPPNVLGEAEYFKRLTHQEYYTYMFSPDRMVRVCDNQRYKHYATLQYIFDNDILADDGFQIDISSINFPVDHYDKIVIGNRIGKLYYGSGYEVDLEDTGMLITVKMDVPKDTKWDIILYIEDN